LPAGRRYPFRCVMSAEVINLSCYKFAPLDGLEELKTRLQEAAKANGLKGTILLAPEGINFFLAGTRSQLASVLGIIRALPGLADIAPKESPSSEQPFKRMLVKVKKEIIAFGVEGVDPARRPAAKISAKQLKQWLDEGRPVTLLDTRNDYEVRMGTFKGAVVPKIWNFRDFPAAVEKLPAALKTQPVVMFCTGGIRCEKAGPFMALQGYTNVLQLDGGILKYFEEVGGAHYEGECFVFDERVGVGPDLRETGSVVCFNCQMPLTLADQRRPDYVYEKTCLHCVDGKPKGRGNTAQRGA
jgi:UPF0176 protein